MNDFDDKLAQSQPQPKRPLSADFTSRIVSRLQTQPKPLGAWAKAKENMKLLVKKPAFIVAALAVIVLGGTAYATTDGFTKVPEFVNAILGKTETLQNGDKIVRVDANCDSQYFADYAYDGQPLPTDTLFYRIDKDSDVSPEELVKAVQGKCEMSKRLEWWNPVMQNLRDTYGDNIYTSDYEKIEQINATSMKVSGVAHFDRGPVISDEAPYTATYSNVSSTTKVYSATGSTLAVTDLKPGQYVQFVYDDGVGTPVETWQNYVKGKVQIDLPVVGIFVIGENEMTTMQLWQKKSFVFAQVKPCKDNPKEWCRVDDPNADTGTGQLLPNIPLARTQVSIQGKQTVAAQVVQEMYTNYIHGLNTATMSLDSINKETQAYFTQAYNDKMAETKLSHDQYMCAQEYPLSITITDVGGGRIDALAHWGAGDDATIKLTVTSENKISDLVCPVQ